MNSLLARMWLVVAIALLPVLGFQAYSEIQARTARRHMMEDEALRLVRLVSSNEQRIIEGAEQVLTAISGSPSVQDGNPEACRRLLANLLRQSPRYAGAAVVGLTGTSSARRVPSIPPSTCPIAAISALLWSRAASSSATMKVAAAPAWQA